MRLNPPLKFALCHGLNIALHELLTWLIICVTSKKLKTRKNENVTEVTKG